MEFLTRDGWKIMAQEFEPCETTLSNAEMLTHTQRVNSQQVLGVQVDIWDRFL